MNDKNDCIESIVRMLERTSAWRKAITANFPDDPRNMRAAETLDKLAVDAAAMTDEQWFELKPYYGWASMPWRNATSQATRQVGFHNRQRDIASFIQALVRELALSNVVAA